LIFLGIIFRTKKARKPLIRLEKREPLQSDRATTEQDALNAPVSDRKGKTKGNRPAEGEGGYTSRFWPPSKSRRWRKHSDRYWNRLTFGEN